MAVKVVYVGGAKDKNDETRRPTVSYVGAGNLPQASSLRAQQTVQMPQQEQSTERQKQKEKKFDAGQYAEDAGKLFLNGVAEGFAATGAAVENWIGKGLDKLFPGAGFEGSGLFNVLYNGRPDWKWAGENGLVGIKQDREYNQESLQENAERTDSKLLQKAAEFGGDIAYGLGNAAPMAATAMVTGGASAAAALTKEGLLKKGAEVVEKSGVLNSMSQAARDMLTSRDYWTSFASEVGMDYYDALDSGATEDEALRYALSSAGLNSVIEIGGGIQKIPEKPTFRTWLKSAHEEGMEEIQQGVVSRLLENVVYNKGNPIASVTDENAVFNPVTALGEYAGGAAVGGILSGGQQLTQRGINNAQYKRAYGTSAQDLVKESLELNPDNELATKLQKKLDARKKLTGSELRQLVEQNEIDIVDGDRAAIQTAAEARLTELGETENVPQVAEAIARQAAGERITDAEKTLLEGSKRARQVRQELNPENIRVGATDEAWTGQIGTERINRAAYNRGIQENGVTGAKYNTETGKLDAIVKDDAGKIKTVPAEKAELSPLQEELFDWAADLGEAGPVLVSAYRQTQNLETYARQFHNAFEYGKAGVPMDYVNRSQAVSYLNTTQREIAYEEGAKAHQRELQGRQEKKRSGGTVDSSTQKKPTVSLRGAAVGGVKYAPVNKKAMDGRQWASVGTMKAFAQATGVNVVFYESQANERGEYEGANGFYKDGTLYLDINAGRDRVAMGETAILKTAAHEITHYIKEGSPEQYEVLKNFVVEKLTREKGISFDDLVTDKQRREPGLSYEEAVDEVVADACEMMLKDSRAVEQLARENRSLAERIRQWIRKWVRSLKAAMEGLTADRPESRAMMQYARELQEIWDNALVDAARNGRGAVETDTRAQASARKKYWRPDLAENEWRLLERRMRKEIGSRENILDEATKWVYAIEKGVQVFALYGIGDGTDATPLYAVGGEKAAAYNAAMTEFMERSQKYDGDGGSVDPLSELPWRKEGSRSGNLSQTSRKAGDAERVSELHVGSQGIDSGGAAERSSENQRKVKEKFSMREPVEETRDLIALHNMTLDNLRGALKLGGLPMPSIAIVKASAGHSKYGPISVVFEKNTIDPQSDRRNKVYGGDAYTPTAPQVEYPVQYKAMQRVEKHIAELSEQVAGGIFRNDTSLRRLGIDSESSMDTETLADRLARDDSVQAAYLADTGKTLEPVRKLKEFSRYGNGALQQLVSEIGVQELARINAEMETGNYDAAADAEKAVRDIIRSAYEVKHRSFLDRKLELKKQRIDKYMENNVSRMTVEDFVRDAWEFYQDNGATTDEVDQWATADKLHEEVNPADVKDWLLGQLDGVLGEAGIYNGKERYTPSGNERSFAQTHYAYTLENIVRAMSQTQEERGGQTFGVTAKSMQAVSTPSYGSIAEIKADSGRLGAVEGDAYDAAVEKVEKQIEQATRKVMRENKPHSDNQFDETQIIGEVMMEAAKGAKTESAIRKVFLREGYSVSKETIGIMQAVFRSAAQLPTEYFEAKPQRAIRFDEAAAVVVPDNIPAEIKQGLKKQGATIREYKAGDEQSRLEAVNADERVRFSLRSVPPVKPKNGGWERGATFDEVKTEHPTLFALDADESSTRNPTQISGTVKSYRKIFDALKEEGFDGTILDASSGLGYGTRLGREEYGYRVDDIEPFPDAKYKPRYTDYSALDNTYDAIISNAVLNVIPQDLRDAMVVKIGEMLNPGGRAFINVRGTDVKNASSKVAINESGMEYFISNTGSYQKGFTTKELVAYLRDALGDGFTVRATNKFGAVSAIVTKNEESGQFQQREPRLTDRAVLSLAADMALQQKNKSWTAEDREQLERFRNRMRMLQDTQAELEALKEERKVLLAGRKVSEITGEERTELTKNKNRIDIAKNKAERYEAAVWELESKAAIKTLLRKSREVVETEASYQARKEYRERQEEREMVNVTRRKVERNAKRLLEYMNTNTDKKHIPEALKKPIGELLESLNFFSNSARRGGYTSRADLKYYEAMQGLQAALATQRAFDDTGEGTDVFKGYLDLPAGFESLLAVHVQRVKDVVEKHPLKTDVLKMMDLGDLRDLDVILSVMSRSVTKMNEMFIKRRFAYVADAAEDSIFAMQRLGQHQDKPGERFALWDNTLPWYAFQRFGEGGKAVFEGLQDGWDKLAFNMKTILDFRQGLISDDQARKWDTETHKVELTDPDGSKVTATLTTAQLMSLYCLSKRKQALGHLLGGGIRPDAIEVTNTLGDKIKKKKWNQDKQFKLTEESLGQLLKLLTPEQIKVADAMQKFMTEQGSAWGNAISMERFGYRAFTEQNYFPIETDQQDREAKTGDAKEGSLYRLQNISAVKPLVKNANNALILRGIFDVFANHTADMAKYNAMVLPIIDAQKWYNYRYGEKNEAGQVNTRTVQRAMTKAYGEVANNFVIKYLQDLNGVKENGDRGDTIPKRMISNYKRAMVAANMRVALLQPTAYVRASAVLDYKYLLKAFKDKTGTKQATKEMMDNSGIALWKSLGFFDTDVGRSIRDQIKGKSSKIDDLVDKTMVPAEKGDVVTWARLWRACKLEVQDKQHLTGEELLNATAERFREVIYRTQVVDSTMTRSHAMRGSGTLTKMATSFMSEPTVSYNMVMESTRQIAEDAKRMGLRTAIRRNWKTAGRAYQAYIVSAIVTAIVESLYDALRDSDDDKYLEKVWKALGGEKPETVKDGILDVIFGLNGNLAGDINPIGKVPYLRDVVSILGGYSNGRMDTEAVANLKKAIDIWDEVIRLQTGDLDKATKTTYYGNMTTYGMIYPTAKALSQLTGLPGSAAMREVATAWNTTVGTVWPALKMRTYEDKKLREAWENYGKDSGVSYTVMYRAIQDLKEFESDRDADGNAISGSLKAKYVEYIRGMGLTRAQEKAVWEAAKNSSWSDKGTPWG